MNEVTTEYALGLNPRWTEADRERIARQIEADDVRHFEEVPSGGYLNAVDADGYIAWALWPGTISFRRGAPVVPSDAHLSPSKQRWDVRLSTYKPRPGRARASLHSMRIPDEVWDAAKARSEAEGTSVSAEVVAFLRRYGGTD